MSTAIDDIRPSRPSWPTSHRGPLLREAVRKVIGESKFRCFRAITLLEVMGLEGRTCGEKGKTATIRIVSMENLRYIDLYLLELRCMFYSFSQVIHHGCLCSVYLHHVAKKFNFLMQSFFVFQALDTGLLDNITPIHRRRIPERVFYAVFK